MENYVPATPEELWKPGTRCELLSKWESVWFNMGVLYLTAKSQGELVGVNQLTPDGSCIVLSILFDEHKTLGPGKIDSIHVLGLGPA